MQAHAVVNLLLQLINFISIRFECPMSVIGSSMTPENNVKVRTCSKPWLVRTNSDNYRLGSINEWLQSIELSSPKTQSREFRCRNQTKMTK